MSFEPPQSGAEMALLNYFNLRARRVPAPFPIWLIDVPGQLSSRLLNVLSESEHARASRFRTSALRRRYCAAHAGLRLLGELCLGVAAARQQYETNGYGKLQLAGAEPAQCSLSYCGERALVAWAWGPAIGIDAEVVRPVAHSADLMQFHFTRHEQQRLRSLEAGRDVLDRSFLTVWVRKEACLKAIGRGLDVELSSFECGVDQRNRMVEVGGQRVESKVLQVEEHLLVAWARCRPDLPA